MIFKNLIDMLKKTWKYLIVALVVVVLLRWKFGPEFLDLFGVIVFGGLIFVGLYGLYTQKKLNNWILFLMLIIGLGGIIVDGITSFNLIKSWLVGGLG